MDVPKTIPKAVVRALMDEVGIKRASDEAVEMVRRAARAYIVELSSKAKMAADHAGRITVRPEDVKFAIDVLSK